MILAPSTGNTRPIYISLAILALIAIIFIGYQDAPANGFHFDDNVNIVNHAPIRLDKLSLSGLIHAGQEAVLSSRPLPNITFAIDWWRGGGEPSTFQWTNITIHALTSLAIFALSSLIILQFKGHLSNYNLWCVFLGTAFWAIHPIQIQGVTYIVQRMASMATLFSILSVLSYLCGRLHPEKRIFWYSLCGLAMLCGGLSKENAWITPLLLLLAEYGVCRHKKPLIQSHWDYFWLSLPILLGIYIIIDLTWGLLLSDYVQSGFAQRSFTLTERLLTQPRVILFHLSQVLWPLPGRFSIEHSFPISTGIFQPASTILAISVMLLWIGAGICFLLSQKNRLWGFCLLWIPLTLAIESTFIPLEIIYEHRMYLPMVGISIILVLCLTSLPPHNRGRMLAANGAASIFIALCLTFTMQRVPEWRNNLTLYESALIHAPNSTRNLGNLSLAYLDKGRLEDSAKIARRALQIDPDNSFSLEALAIYHMELGNLKEADRYFKRSAKNGTRDNLMNHWGELMVLQGRYQDALNMFSYAIKRTPWVSTYHWNIALTFERLDSCQMARAHWEKFLRLKSSADDRQMVAAHITEEHETSGGKCFRK
ncbi:hypothetical protein MNBD_GAMMA26-1786 [hydrothermal vent metagenome]|uniref:Tetratricopeptide repeat protein n=1 Tax=hydrothermal vent metagenome TaxID=652676 RepID=A0A3B1BFT6_9ZZZZ